MTLPIPPRYRPRGPARPIAATVGCLLFLVGLSAPGPARAANDLNVEMAEVTGQIKLLLDQMGQTAIAVGDFRGPAKLAASAGPAISKALIEDRKSTLLAVQIKAHVVDHSGDEVVAFEPRGILNVSTIATLIGATAEIPADATAEERNEKLTEAVDNPQVTLASTRISAVSGSPYAIAILVKAAKEYQPRAASKDDDGFAFLKIRRDELYEVKLINDSPHDAAVTLTIDGLSSFTFSENHGYTHWIVPAGKALIVPGWHWTNQVSDAFQVTEYAKGAAVEKLPSSSSVGTITATFDAAWPQGSPPPDGEAASARGGRSGDATDKGPAVETSFSEYVREIGRLRASITVRYTKDDDPGDLPDSRP